MQNYAKRLLYYLLRNFEELVAGIMLILILVMVLMEIFFRYVIGSSLIWPEEISRILFIWSILLGGACGIKRKKLISIDIIYRLISVRGKFIFDTIVFLFLLFILFYLGRAGIDFTFRYAWDPTPLLRLPRLYLYASIPVGVFFMLIRLIESYYHTFTTFKHERFTTKSTLS